jgi:hypothetical protein
MKISFPSSAEFAIRQRKKREFDIRTPFACYQRDARIPTLVIAVISEHERYVALLKNKAHEKFKNAE